MRKVYKHLTVLTLVFFRAGLTLNLTFCLSGSAYNPPNYFDYIYPHHYQTWSDSTFSFLPSPWLQVPYWLFLTNMNGKALSATSHTILNWRLDWRRSELDGNLYEREFVDSQEMPISRQDHEYFYGREASDGFEAREPSMFSTMARIRSVKLACFIHVKRNPLNRSIVKREPRE